jgi:hypothetical protein
VGQGDELFQRIEFVVFVFVAAGVGRVRIGEKSLRRLGADLENDRLGLAPSVASTSAVDDRRDGEVSALACVAVGLFSAAEAEAALASIVIDNKPTRFIGSRVTCRPLSARPR